MNKKQAKKHNAQVQKKYKDIENLLYFCKKCENKVESIDLIDGYCDRCANN